MDIGYFIEAVISHANFIALVFGLLALHIWLAWIR
jgi:hypothetical protein